MENEIFATHYFDNDIVDMIQDEVNNAIGCPMEALQFSYMDSEEMYDFIRDYVKKYGHEQEEAVKQALRNIDPFEDMDINESYDKWDALMDAFYKDEKAVDELAERFSDILYKDEFYVQDQLENARDNANYRLEEDGFIGNNEPYIILGIGMGWRSRTGYKMKKLNSLEDMENAITGNYDYTISLERNANECWLTASVSSHDAPTGETYYLIPLKNAKEAMKNEVIRKLMERFEAYIEEDKEYIA